MVLNFYGEIKLGKDFYCSSPRGFTGVHSKEFHGYEEHF